MILRKGGLLAASILGTVVSLGLPGAAWAAQEAGGRSELYMEIGKLTNLLLVVAVLVWVSRKPLAHFFAGRSKAIRDQLDEAQKARQNAEARLAEIEMRMSSLDEELREIKAVSEREAQEEYQRLTAAAEKDADKVVERARREIEGMTRAAQLDLKAQVAELSVQLAKDRIRDEITDEDRKRLFARFVARVGGRE